MYIYTCAYVYTYVFHILIYTYICKQDLEIFPIQRSPVEVWEQASDHGNISRQSEEPSRDTNSCTHTHCNMITHFFWILTDASVCVQWLKLKSPDLQTSTQKFKKQVNKIQLCYFSKNHVVQIYCSLHIGSFLNLRFTVATVNPKFWRDLQSYISVVKIEALQRFQYQQTGNICKIILFKPT